MSGNIDDPPIALSQLSEAGPDKPIPARLFYIDNMRVVLIILVVVGHMAITYGASLGEWYYHEEGEVSEVFSIITALLLGIGASFLLGLFFMIAGYFSAGTLRKKGTVKFVIDRLVRLGLPLFFYAVLINPLVTYWAAVHGGYVGSFFQYVPGHLPELQNASVGPLWFVEALLIFSLVYSLIYALAYRKFPASPTRDAKPIPGTFKILLFSFCLGLATFLIRIWAPFGWWWEPLHQEIGHFPQYVAMFSVGVVAHRSNWFEAFPSSQARIWKWITLILLPCLPVLAVAAGALEGRFDERITGGFHWLSIVYSFWEALIGVALVISTMVWFRDRFNHQGGLMSKMAGSAYGVYVLHPLIIVPFTLALSELHMDLFLKFLLFTPLAVILCFISTFVIRKLPLVKNIL